MSDIGNGVSRRIEEVSLAYWELLDFRGSAAIADIFTPDGELHLGSKAIIGRDAIAAFLSERHAAQIDRLTRHICSNFHVHRTSAEEAEANSLVTVFAGAGTIPFASLEPNSINDVFDLYVRGADGWRLRRRTIRTIFAGPNVPDFLSVKTPT